MNQQDGDELTPIVSFHNQPNNVVVNKSNDDVTEEHNFNWSQILVEITVTLVMAFSILYFLLIINEIAHYDHEQRFSTLNNSVEVFFLICSFGIILTYLIQFHEDNNPYHDIKKFLNYPMLVTMIICAFFDTMYYFMNFVSIATKKFNPSRMCATLSELMFASVILPFAIISICYKVRPKELRAETKTKICLLFTMAGCFIIFMTRVGIKVKKDMNFTEVSNFTESNDRKLIHDRTSSAENILELVDITYILVVLIFLIDPFIKVMKPKRKDEDKRIESTIVPFFSFYETVSFARNRLPTIIISLILVVILMVGCYVITGIDNFTKSSYLIAQVVFLSFNVVTYLIGIIYGSIYLAYYLSDWLPKAGEYIRSDEHFNKFSTSFQILYASVMILSYILKWNEEISHQLLTLEIIHFLFMTLQVLIQSECISIAILRQAKINPLATWKANLFPPVALAAINFGFMIVSVIYSQSAIFTDFLKPNHYLIFIIIKDVALPLTILNRLHGMVFFINLSMQQWFK